MQRVRLWELRDQHGRQRLECRRAAASLELKGGVPSGMHGLRHGDGRSLAVSLPGL